MAALANPTIEITPDAAALPRVRLRYVPPDPKLVDLSFAGRLRPGDPSLAAIAAANAAWLALAAIAFNLTRAAARLASATLGKARTATVRISAPPDQMEMQTRVVPLLTSSEARRA